MNAYRERAVVPAEPTAEEEWQRIQADAARADRLGRVVRVLYFGAFPAVLTLAAGVAGGTRDQGIPMLVSCLLSLLGIRIGEALDRKWGLWRPISSRRRR